MSLSIVAGLLIAATTLAVSPQSDQLVAATDGARVWVTEDGGQHWRQIARESAPPDDNEDDEPPWGVRSLTFLGSELFWSTPSGLHAWTRGDAMPKIRSVRAFHALGAWENILFAARDGVLYRSDDRGRSFAAATRTPDGPARSLAVTDKRMLVGTASGTFSYDGVSWRKTFGPAHVAASSDGSLWRAGPLGIERSARPGRWRLVHAGRFSAVAVGPGQVWAATARRVLRVVKSPVPASRAVRAHRAVLGDRLRRALALGQKAHRAAWLPTVHVNASTRFKATGGHSLSRQQETVVFFSLTWPLDDAAAHRAALAALQTAMSIHRLMHQSGARQ